MLKLQLWNVHVNTELQTRFCGHWIVRSKQEIFKSSDVAHALNSVPVSKLPREDLPHTTSAAVKVRETTAPNIFTATMAAEINSNTLVWIELDQVELQNWIVGSRDWMLIFQHFLTLERDGRVYDRGRKCTSRLFWLGTTWQFCCVPYSY